MEHRQTGAAARKAGVRLIRFEYGDVSGVAREQVYPRRALAAHAAGGRQPHPCPDGDQLARSDGAGGRHGSGRRDPPYAGPRHVQPAALGPGLRERAVRPARTRPSRLGCTPALVPERHRGARGGDRPSREATFENEYYLAREVDGRCLPVDTSDHPPVYMTRPVYRPRSWSGATCDRCRPRWGKPSTNWMKDAFLLGSLGDLLSRCYLTVRRSEEASFSAHDVDFENRNHFYRFRLVPGARFDRYARRRQPLSCRRGGPGADGRE